MPVAQARGVIVLASQKHCGRIFEYIPVKESVISPLHLKCRMHRPFIFVFAVQDVLWVTFVPPACSNRSLQTVLMQKSTWKHTKKTGISCITILPHTVMNVSNPTVLSICLSKHFKKMHISSMRKQKHMNFWSFLAMISV